MNDLLKLKGTGLSYGTFIIFTLLTVSILIALDTFLNFLESSLIIESFMNISSLNSLLVTNNDCLETTLSPFFNVDFINSFSNIFKLF